MFKLKQSLIAIAGMLLVVGLVALLIPAKMKGQGGNQQPLNVKVVNPADAPVPRKLNRTVTAPSSRRLRAAITTTLLCIVPPSVGSGWQITAVTGFTGSPSSGQSTWASRGPSGPASVIGPDAVGRKIFFRAVGTHRIEVSVGMPGEDPPPDAPRVAVELQTGMAFPL